MRKVLAVAAGVVAFLLAVAVVAAATSPGIHAPTRIRVVEHAEAATEIEIDTDNSGGTHDTTGDLLTFHNKVYDATDSKVIGRDLGECVLVVVGAAYDCAPGGPPYPPSTARNSSRSGATWYVASTWPSSASTVL